MTWLMFDNKLMCAETGAYFYVRGNGILHVSGSYDNEGSRVTQVGEWPSEAEATARFDELKGLLIKDESCSK